MTKAWLQGLAVAIGLFGVSHSVLAATLNYSVYNNASGDIYLKAPAKFILIHADISVPLMVMPANGYMKLMLQSDGKRSLSIITAEEWNQLSLQLAAGQIAAVNEKDLNGDGLADYSVSLSLPQRVFSFLKQSTGAYTSLEIEATRPAISPNGGTYNSSVQVSLTTVTPGAEIRYTTNGADVTSSSQLYTGAFPLVTSSTVKAKSFKAGMAGSIATIANFVVQDAPIVGTPQLPELKAVPLPGMGLDSSLTVPGQFDVTSTGQANYTVPILTAKGSAGFAPLVSLNYSSGGSNGLLGLGWSLSSSGDISRCRQTYGADRNALPISWSSDDRFCLNGQRLLVVTGNYGDVASTYKTEIDSHSLITAVGGSAGHPDYFKVEYKDGTWETYGNSSDSANSKHQLASNSSSTLAWALSKRSDSANNKIIYKYLSDSYGHRLDTIDFAYGNTTTRNAHLKFEYEERDDLISGFIAGYYHNTNLRLREITSYNGSQELRKYLISYNLDSADTTNDTLSRLSRIEECVGSTCLPATNFEWSIPVSQFTQTPSTMAFTSGVSQFTLGDINGDGVSDVAWYEQAETADLHDNLKPRAYRYALGALSNGVFSWSPSHRSAAIYKDLQLSLVDLNNDGKSEIIAGESDRLSSTMFIDVNSDGLVDRLHSQYQRPWVNYYGYGAAVLQLAGVNTAQSPDSALYYGLQSAIPFKQQFSSTTHIPSEQDALTALSTTYYLQRNASGVITLNNFHLSPIHSLSGLTGDMDGDGRMDIVANSWTAHGQCYQDNDYDHCEWENTAPALYTTEQSASGQFELVYKSGFDVTQESSRSITTDLNGDGLTDIVFARGMTDWAFRLSNGVSFESAVSINISGRPFNSYNSNVTDVALADFNADGYPDIIWHSPNQPFTSTTTGNGSGSIKVKYWVPALNRFSDDDVVLQSLNYAVLANYGDARYGWNHSFARFKTTEIQMADVNADGKADLIVTPAIQNGSISAYLAQKADQAENTIIAIHKGLGERIDVKYEPITHSAHYARGDIVNGATTQQQCTSVADSGGSYTQQMCWDVAVGELNAASLSLNLNDPWHKLSEDQQSLRPTEPTFSKATPMYVVTEVSASSPSASNSEDQYRTAYFYEQARMQSSGRGFLGFEYFTKVDLETGIRTRQQYRQDWPYSGKVLKTEAFTKDGYTLYGTKTTYGLAQCYFNGTADNHCVKELSQTLAVNGSAAVGPLQIFVAEQYEQSWSLENNGSAQGLLLKESTTTTQVDLHGNAVHEQQVLKDGIGIVQRETITTRDYDKSGSTWSMQLGRLKALNVTNTNERGSITRDSAFDYYTSGTEIGLLKTETIEPNQTEFSVTTTYTYNNGNLVLSSTTANGQTRVKDVRYDTTGRYVNDHYELFSATTGPDTGISRKSYSVVSRDKYGTPTEERSYTGSATYLTKLTGTTAFGTVYFSSDSSGAYTLVDAGLGSNTLCPATAISWRTQLQAGGETKLQCLDVLKRVVREAVGGFAADSWSSTDTDYTRRGLVNRTSNPYLVSQDTPSWTSYQHDILGRITATEASVNDGTLVTTGVRYEGYNTITVNGLDQQRTETHNALGELVKVTDPVNGITTYSYDARGNLASLTDPANNATSIQYDLLDRKISMDEPNKGHWTYKYNSFNELVCQKDAKGQIVLQKYDLLGRLFSRTEYKSGGTCEAPTGNVEKFNRWEYDSAENGLGKLNRIFDSTSIDGAPQYQQSYTFDTVGRLSITTTAMPGHLGVQGVHYEKATYDQYGRLFQKFDAARTTNDFNVNGVEYRYTDTGYLHQIVDSVNQQGMRPAFYTVHQMDAAGHVTNAEYGNGVTLQHNYHKDSGTPKELKAYAIVGGNTPLQHLTLEWDEIGNLESRHETGSAGAAFGRNIREAFTYDDLNQLTQWQTSGELSLTETASINAVGNIQSKSGTGNYFYGTSCSHSSNAGPNAVCQAGSTTYVYDNNGNLMSDSSGRTMQYSVSDLLSQVTKSGHTTSFNYGPTGQRYKRTDSNGGQITTTLYLGSVEKVYHPDNSIEWKRVIEGVGLFTQKVTRSGAVLEERKRYQLKDHLGSLSLITDEVGFVEQSHYFDPWGQVRKIVTASSTKSFALDSPFKLSLKPLTGRGFTGHEQLDETGLIHMNGRAYDAKLGRFIQADPLIQDPTKVQSLNRYSYVWNNPLNATDPSGFLCTGQSCEAELNKQKDKEVEHVEVKGRRPSPLTEAHRMAIKRYVKMALIQQISQNSFFNSSMFQAQDTDGWKFIGHQGSDGSYVDGRYGKTFSREEILNAVDDSGMLALGVSMLPFEGADCLSKGCTSGEWVWAVAAMNPVVKSVDRGVKVVRVAESATKLRRPYLRKSTRGVIQGAAPKTPDGKFIDPNTGKVIEGKFHYGHKYGHEHRRLKAEAEAKGMTQKEFNDHINNNPQYFQIEDPVSNMSHIFEKPGG